MSNYRPQVGDRIRQDSYPKGVLQVTAVGRDWLLALDDGDAEDMYDLHPEVYGSWVKVETPEPLPERWGVVIADHPETLLTRDDALKKAERQEIGRPVALLHWWSDGDGDHAEIERL